MSELHVNGTSWVLTALAGDRERGAKIVVEFWPDIDDKTAESLSAEIKRAIKEMRG